ncbi:hypothetical protein [Candidatus Venteria ishoeyi]|uniref:Uncharacterized protein n=1 Tax=Candidatus Venteria ishoeyi TaxID=1899563 RepID=A0A1H6FBM3_9GAMM|nr:hypothetical protein [Candidatus Venteria ishoeyi]SEH06424.1 Uncharacterised protein [Candidatus Venteria ishoeyi]
MSGFLQQYRTLSGFDTMQSDWQYKQVFTELLDTLQNDTFPGAVLPRLQGEQLYFYAVAPTPQNWRQLRPLLLAYAGPTVTDFDSLPRALNPHDPLEQYLDKCLQTPDFHLIIKFSATPATQKLALGALSRLRQNLSHAEIPQWVKPEPTSLLLQQFRLALLNTDRTTAASLLQRMHQEYRLDALNLRFLQVQLHAEFHEWHALREAEFFNALCHTRRPDAVSRALLTAFYYTELADLEDAPPACLKHFQTHVRPHTGTLLHTLPVNSTEPVCKLFALEKEVITAETQSSQRKNKLKFAKNTEGSQQEAHLKIFSLRPPCFCGEFQSLLEKPPTLETAKAVLLTANELNTLESRCDCVAYIRRLPATDFETLLKPAWLRELWYSFDSKHLPANWLEWLQHIEYPDFTAALDVAERGREEWPSAKALGTTPEAVQQFTDILIAVPDGIPQQRLALALPLLVEWVQNDPGYPNPLLVPVYDSLLKLMERHDMVFCCPVDFGYAKIIKN